MPNASRAPRILLQTLLGLAAAILAGFLLQGFWELFGLPDRPSPGFWQELVRPWGLRRLVVLALPAAAFLPTLVLGLLTLLLPAGADPELQGHCRQAQRYDAYTYLLLAAGVVLVLVWDLLGNGFLALGLCYLGLITAKALILVRLLWQAFLAPSAQAPPGPRRHKYWAVFLVALVVFALPAAWLNQSVSASRGEAVYLLKAHDLVASRPGPTAEPGRPHRGFFWGQGTLEQLRWPPGDLVEVFAVLVAPPYAGAGRLGVLLLQALLMALLATQLLAWLEGAGVPPGPAASAAGLALTAAPVYFAAGQVLPEAAAMLLTVCGLRLLSGLGQARWGGLLLLIPLCLVLALLDLRFLPLAAALLGLGVFETLRGKAGALWAGLVLAAAAAGAAALAWYLPLEAWPLGLGQRLALHLSWWQQALHWWTPLGVFGASLLLDQSYGLLLIAPIFLLALGGVPASLRRWPRPTLHLLIAGLIYLAATCLDAWYHLPGELSPPGRLLAVLLPACGLFMAPVLAALSRPWWRLAVWIPAAWGLAYTWLLTLLPWLRFGRPGAANPLAQAAGRGLGLELGPLLPSGIAISPMLIAALVVAGLITVFYLLAGLRPAPAAASRWQANEALATALALGLLAWGLLAAAALGAP